MNTADATDYYCTKPFDANPDVSGIGVSTQRKSIESYVIHCFQILVAFYGQAILSFFLSTVIDILWYFFRHKTYLRERIEALHLGLITDWVTVGFAMTIAGLSQWSTISMFHLFLCSNLADTIVIQIPSWRNLINWRSNRLQIIYFTSYSMIRITLLSYLIHRFVRFWSNTPGECFIPYEGGTGSPDELLILIVGMGLSIAWDVYFIIVAIFEIHKAAVKHRSQEIEKSIGAGAQDTEAVSTNNQKTQEAAFWTKRKENACIFLAKFKVKTRDTGFWTKRTKHVIIFLSRAALRGGFLAWNAYWTITFVLANRTHISGNEYIFSFGQVGALVTLAASVYKILNSYLGKPCIPSSLSNPSR